MNPRRSETYLPERGTDMSPCKTAKTQGKQFYAFARSPESAIYSCGSGLTGWCVRDLIDDAPCEQQVAGIVGIESNDEVGDPEAAVAYYERRVQQNKAKGIVYPNAQQIEAQLKPIGEAAVKRLRKENGIERAVLRVVEEGKETYIYEGEELHAQVFRSGRKFERQWVAAPLMLEALKACKEFMCTDICECNLCTMVNKAIACAEGKGDSDAER